MPTEKKTRHSLGRPRSMESEYAILDAAMELLEKEGYVGLTLLKVAKRARASKATIYRRWPSKEHLVVAAVSRLPDLAPQEKGNLIEELVDLHRQHLERMHSGYIHGLLPQLTAARTHDPSLAAALDPYIHRRREPMRTVFRWAIARGEIPADTDIELAVDVVTGVNYLRQYSAPASSAANTVESMRNVFELLLRGLQQSTPRRSVVPCA